MEGSYYIIKVPEGPKAQLDSWFAARPTLGIGLDERSSRRCSVGAVATDDPISAARSTALPPSGCRVVVGRVDLEVLLAFAILETRAAGQGRTSAARIASLIRALRRGPHLCRRVMGADHSAFADGDPALVHAALCRVVDERRLPLRFRADAVRAFVLQGWFPGQARAVARLRRWMDRHLDVDTGSAPGGRPTPAAVPAGTRSHAPDAAAEVRQRLAPARTPAPSTVSIRPHVIADAALYAAWERVRDNARARGSWSRDMAGFEARLGRELSRIAAALADGTWQPSRPRHVKLAKSAGGIRHLHVPKVADRVVERALSSAISDAVDERLSPWSFAFRPGRSVDDAVREVASLRDEGGSHAARFDLLDCFSSVDRRRLRDALRRFVADPWVLDITDRLLRRDLPGIDTREGLIGIAQGSPLSPLLCNLVLDDVDRALVRVGFPAVRYADDLAYVGGCAYEAQEALRVAEEVAREYGFSLNERKSRVVPFGQVVEYLGQRIGPDSPPSDPGADDEPPKKRTLYLTSRTSNVHLRRGQVRAVGRDGGEVASVPVSGIGRIVCMGPAAVSAGLRSHALINDVDVVFLSRNGSWLGRYDGDAHADPRLRREQYRLLDDEHGMMAIARRFVVGKIVNQRALVLRYGRRSSAAVTCRVASRLDDLVPVAEAANTTEELMGYEGVATREYHKALTALFPSEAGFAGRTKRPPKDPANAVLSFGYTLLTGEVRAACAIAGADVHVGILHVSARRRPSLALDLMEEFRPLLVDTVALSLFRRDRIQARHFRRRTRDGAVLLNDAGRRILLDAYETRLLSRFRSARTGTRITYRDALRVQAGHLADVILGCRERYEPVVWR